MSLGATKFDIFLVNALYTYLKQFNNRSIVINRSAHNSFPHSLAIESNRLITATKTRSFGILRGRFLRLPGCSRCRVSALRRHWIWRQIYRRWRLLKHHLDKARPILKLMCPKVQFTVYLSKKFQRKIQLFRQKTAILKRTTCAWKVT